MEITSVNNEQVKETVKLQQRKYRNFCGKFILEGYKSIKEAFDYGIKLEYIFTTREKLDEYNFAKDIVILTNTSVLKKLSTTDSTPEAVAVGIQKIYDKEILKSTKKVVLLENIKDPGNLGTIIRTSVAFSADAIVLYGDSVDIYNPKIVRSSVGNLWKIPIINIDEFSDIEKYFENFCRIATLPRSNNLLKNFKLQTPILLMFGSEADGLSDNLIKYATNSVKIEMNDNVESLNLATSVAVTLYELFK